jgi:three-Cys-motif partner protein
MARMTSEEILAELRADDDGHLVRPIGIWSLEKLATLFLYFRAFSTACQSVGGGHYVDGFAGPGKCRVKNARPGPYYAWGSPLLGLRNSPSFERCTLLDIRASNVEALRARAASHGQKASIHCGDVNDELDRLVREQVPSGAPCFCLLDPQGIELAWSTVARVSKIPRRTRKPELLILFPLRMALLRLMTTQRAITPRMSERLDRTFGSHAWAAVHETRVAGQITPREAQLQYLEDYCSSLRNLGYGWVRWKAITAPRAPGLRRQEMYHLIFATDHEAGDKIMEDVFRRPYVLDFPVSAQHRLFE